MCCLCLFVALLFFLPLFSTQPFVASSVEFHVGVILDLNSTDSPVGTIGVRSLSMALSDFYSSHKDYKTRLVLHPIDANGSVVDAAAAALHLLQDVKVDAIIGPQKTTQVNFVMDLGDRAQVPIISFSATSPSLVHRSRYFVQAAQSDANQVEAIASVVKAFMWTQVVIIYEDTEFGTGIMPYLSNAIHDVNAHVAYRSVLPRSATDDFITNQLYKMMTMQTRVFVVHMSQFLGTRLFLKARELGMMSEGYAWIVTSGITDLFSSISSDAAEAMQGVVGVRPLISKSKELHSFASRLRKFDDMKQHEMSIFGLWAYDTLWALGMAAERVGISSSNATENKKSDNFTSPFTSGVSETGPRLLQEFKGTDFTGVSGEFNLADGQLKQTSYEIVNVVGSIERPVGIWIPAGGISRTSAAKEKLRTIIWPGDSTKKPRGWEDPINGKKLRIAVPMKPGFNDFLRVEKDPITNEINVSGYYRDVFDSVMRALPYSLQYDFVAFPFIKPDGSRCGNYDELVYQVSLQTDYDGALGDITITANRSEYADFTMPFAEGGVACIVPIKYEDVNNVLTFLQPLTIQLWLATAVLYISTAVVTWVLAKRVVQSSRDSLVGMNYLLPFFPGERVEVILICLILVTWAFVANLLNSTYTANLSSRLTIATLRGTVMNVKELIAHGDYVGYQEGSFLQSFLIKQGFDKSRLRSYTSVDDCTKALSSGSRRNGASAYCDVLPHIKLILSESCGKYMMIDPIYRTDGFAFAFPKAFPAVADISRAIVQLTEAGKILEIDQRKLLTPECLDPRGRSSPGRVSLRSFSVLFAITAFVTLACFLASFLIHLHNKRSLPQRMTNFRANASSRIHQFLKRDEPSSLPATTNSTREEQEVGSSDDHIRV